MRGSDCPSLSQPPGTLSYFLPPTHPHDFPGHHSAFYPCCAPEPDASWGGRKFSCSPAAKLFIFRENCFHKEERLCSSLPPPNFPYRPHSGWPDPALLWGPLP